MSFWTCKRTHLSNMNEIQEVLIVLFSCSGAFFRFIMHAHLRLNSRCLHFAFAFVLFFKVVFHMARICFRKYFIFVIVLRFVSTEKGRHTIFFDIKVVQANFRHILKVKKFIYSVFNFHLLLSFRYQTCFSCRRQLRTVSMYKLAKQLSC